MAEIDNPCAGPTAANTATSASSETPSTFTCARVGTLRVGQPLASRDEPQDPDEVQSTSPADQT